MKDENIVFTYRIENKSQIEILTIMSSPTPPMPWMALPTISILILVAKADTNVPRMCYHVRARLYH